MRVSCEFCENFRDIFFFTTPPRELLLKMDILQNSCSAEYQADSMIQIFEKHQ